MHEISVAGSDARRFYFHCLRRASQFKFWLASSDKQAKDDTGMQSDEPSNQNARKLLFQYQTHRGNTYADKF